jgi:glutathione synthase/RimK-type ligase-like ATP-grasp enzyme
MKVVLLTFQPTTTLKLDPTPKIPIELSEEQKKRFEVFHPLCRTVEHAVLLSLLNCDSTVVHWRDYEPQMDDVVLFREVWDYHEHYQEFSRFLDRLESMRIHCINSIPTMRWNMDKKYLFELQSKGVRIAPSMLLSKTVSQQVVLDHFGSSQLVLKPTISAGSYQTFRFDGTDPSWVDKLEQILQHSNALAQPFLEEIKNDGEFSLLFFGGQFSYSILKKPHQDGWFVQVPYGGTFAQCTVPESTKDTAYEILKVASQLINPNRRIEELMPIVRVDGIIRGGEFLLCELEAIESFLNMTVKPSSFNQLAMVITEHITQRKR